ncbi:MAG TPA: hypothetical protein VHM28_06995 [Anaerolineales bacterium]|jgi:hypothetical protein|nr:hypothetical protein [Anaerolineales bacterium]
MKPFALASGLGLVSNLQTCPFTGLTLSLSETKIGQEIADWGWGSADVMTLGSEMVAFPIWLGQDSGEQAAKPTAIFLEDE